MQLKVTTNRDRLYRRHRFPAEIIAHAGGFIPVSLSALRMVEDMLAAREIIVSHQTVRLWAEKFGRTVANEIRRRSTGKLGDNWHLDEAVISIRGKKHWLWGQAPAAQALEGPLWHCGGFARERPGRSP